MRTKLSLSLDWQRGWQIGLGLLLLLLSACSGDDAKEQTGEDTAADGGTRDSSKSSAASSGHAGKGTGSGKEGVECKSHGDCASGLSCLKADAQIDDLQVCARPCVKTSDCDDGERCWSAGGDPEQAFCWNMVTEPLEPCGPAFTSMCDDTKNLGCLRVESDSGSVAGGVCLQPCKLKNKDACQDGFSCLDIIDLPDDGLCVKAVERGDTCDEPGGQFCDSGNLCLSDRGKWRCYQDCTDSKQCDDDKECNMLNDGDAAYCE